MTLIIVLASDIISAIVNFYANHFAMPPSLPQQEIDSLSDRLSKLEGVTLPASLTRTPEFADQQKRKQYLQSLLARDPGAVSSITSMPHIVINAALWSSTLQCWSAGVFLERHRQHLTSGELSSFGALRDDYEVNFWLKQAEDEAASAAHPGVLSQTSKNRRLAKRNKLLEEGVSLT